MLKLTPTISRFVLDSVPSVHRPLSHVQGNYPDSAMVEGAKVDGGQLDNDTANWRTILPAVKLTAHARHFFGDDHVRSAAGFVTHVRIKMFPDGGISRVRLLGKPTADIEVLQHSLWIRVVDDYLAWTPVHGHQDADDAEDHTTPFHFDSLRQPKRRPSAFNL